MVTVDVYILSSSPESEQTKLVKTLVDDDLFKIKIVDISIPDNYAIKGISKKKSDEIYRCIWVLKNSLENKDNHIMILKDTSVSNSSAANTANIVESIIQGDNFDICYLAKWLDKCELYDSKQAISNMTTILTQTFSPNGAQALLISPKGRNIMIGEQAMSDGSFFTYDKSLSETLKEKISKSNIKATCVVPNLFNVDATKIVAKDFYKTHECADEEKEKEKYKTTDKVEKKEISMSSMRKIIIGIILTALVFAGIWYYYKNSHHMKLTRKCHEVEENSDTSFEDCYNAGMIKLDKIGKK